MGFGKKIEREITHQFTPKKIKRDIKEIAKLNPIYGIGVPLVRSVVRDLKRGNVNDTKRLFNRQGHKIIKDVNRGAKDFTKSVEEIPSGFKLIGEGIIHNNKKDYKKGFRKVSKGVMLLGPFPSLDGSASAGDNSSQIVDAIAIDA